VKKTLLSALAVALLLASTAPARAQDAPKPFAIVALAGYDELRNDVDFIGQLSDNPDLVKSLDGIVALFTQFQGLAGLDKSKPLGVSIATDGQSFQALGFVPVTDIKKLFGALTNYIGQPEDKGDGLYEINAGNVTAYAKVKNGWAYISQTEDGLATLPSDPGKLLGSMTKEYDVAARLNVQNVPKAFRDMFVDKFKEGMEGGLRQKGGDVTDEQREMLRKQADQLFAAVNELDEITVGLSIDSKGRRLFFDTSITAVPGSKTAKQMHAKPAGKSGFAGFLEGEDVLAEVHIFSGIGEDDIANLASTIASAKPAIEKQIDDDDDLEDGEEKTLVKGLVNDLLDVATATVKEGIVDGGLVITDEAPFTLVIGAHVAQPEKLEAVLKKAVNHALKKKDKPEGLEIEWDSDEHKGVRFHTFTFPIPDKDDDAKQAKEILGDDVEIVFGFGKKSVFFALGEDGVDTITDVIDESASADEPEFPAEVNIYLLPILEFAADQQPDNKILGILAKQLAESEKDRIRITSRLIPNGSLGRFEAEEGVLKLIGAAAKLGQGGGR
jgi:hypothetical protein